MPDDEPASGPPAPGHGGDDLAYDSPPLWTHFLIPLAILVGAAGIIVTLFYLDNDDGLSRDDVAAAVNEAVSAAFADLTLAAAPSGGASSPTGPASMLQAMTEYAEQIDLDVDAFRQCLTDPETATVINEHLQRGSALGVTGTPTFFINNKMVVGAQPPAVFQEIIQAELDGSPTSIEAYSDTIRQLAAINPPRFAIIEEPIDLSGAHFEGNPDARVVVAEYSDFQCPFCGRWTAETLPLLRPVLGDDVALAFLHFPILQIHPNAGRAHLAAECAAEQGKFYEMHDLLFQRQQEWQDLPAN
ncbi:MAG: hypothetical protein Kow0010_03690 [Dehalococcoidia bacterium]